MATRWTMDDIVAKGLKIANSGTKASKKSTNGPKNSTSLPNSGMSPGGREKLAIRKTVPIGAVFPGRPDPSAGLKMQVIQGNVPSKSNCYRVITIKGKGSLGKTPALEAYEEAFIWQCGPYRDAGIRGPFEFHIDVYYPSKRSDLDNSLKVVLDCLQRVGAIKNDNNCCKIIARKFIDRENPRIEFKIVTI